MSLHWLQPPGKSPEFITFTLTLYGVAMTGIGMLTLTGNNVAMNSFGPISDNANRIGEIGVARFG